MEKIQNYYNTYDPDKHYTEILYRAGYGSQSREENEVQSIINARIAKLANALFADGDIVEGAQIVVDVETGNVQATSGQIFMNGRIWDLEPCNLQIPVTGSVAVGIHIADKVVSELEDPGLRNPAIGNRAEGLPGAWRRKQWAYWGVGNDGDDAPFYPVYTVEDGVPQAKEAPPALDSFNQAIARYDRDSTGTGTYIVNGLSVVAGENAEDGRQIYHLAEGRARVGGIGVTLPTSRRVPYNAIPDLRNVSMEVVDATSAAQSETGQYVKVAHPPIKNLTSLRVTKEQTFSLVHGSYVGCTDMLPVTGVLAIIEVRQGDTIYAPDTDYIRTGDGVDWSPNGNEPNPGSTISVKARFLEDIQPESLDLDGFTVKGAVAGTQILFGYAQMLPRWDRMAMDQEGQITWFKGVASEQNPQRPEVAAGLLLLATIYQDWREGRQITCDAPFVATFERIASMETRLAWVEGETARNRLALDASTRESGAKVGMFVDPLTDDSMRDQGIEQSAAIVGGFLTLPIINPASKSFDLTEAQALPFGLKTLLEQTLRTGEMKVNPYQAFEPLPAQVSLSPQVDQWTETKTSWASGITQIFDTYHSSYHYARGSGIGPHADSLSTNTQVLASSTTALQYLRQIDLAFELNGFEAGETLVKVTFDGLDMTGSVAASA